MLMENALCVKKIFLSQLMVFAILIMNVKLMIVISVQEIKMEMKDVLSVKMIKH